MPPPGGLMRRPGIHLCRWCGTTKICRPRLPAGAPRSGPLPRPSPVLGEESRAGPHARFLRVHPFPAAARLAATTAARRAHPLRVRLRQVARVRALPAGLLASGLALIGQRLLLPAPAPVTTATVWAAAAWYAASIAVLLLGWWGTYRNI